MKSINVVCAIIIKDDKVFCCQRGPGRALEGFWEFPGGKIEKGEYVHEALKREIREELKSEVNVGLHVSTSEYVYPPMPPYEGFHIRLEAYECELVSGKLELSEHVDAKWLSLTELNSVEWAEADKQIVEEIKCRLTTQRYIITIDNENGQKDTVWVQNCSKVCVMREFERIINEQANLYRSGKLNKWKTIRVFNARGEQVAQES